MHRARKRFGQNFLKDPHVIQKIISAIKPKPSDHFLEIGPGLGVLTKELVNQVKRLDCIEIDRDLTAILNQTFGQSANFQVINQDALKFDLNSLNVDNKSLRIIGNLPYNITTPLLFHLLHFLPLIKDMVFMLQKEVVERITAEPHSKAFGRLTLMIQYYCQTQHLFDVPPEAFSPKPKVMSSVLKLTPFESLPYKAHNFKLLENLVLVSFSHRRKMLSNTLKAYLNVQDFENLKISPEARPENVSLQQWVELSNYIDEHKKQALE